MQDASSNAAGLSRGKRGTILISGTLIALLGAGVAMQVWRAQISKAAEQSQEAGAGRVAVNPTGKPVGRVNGHPITYDELAQECIERHGAEVLQNVINRTLIQQSCAEAGITISDAEVEREIVRISKKFGLPVDQWQKMLESERGLSPIQYRRDVIWPMLALRKLAGQEVKVTREMLQEAYEDNYGPRVKARMLVLDNMRRAQDIWEKLRKTPDEFENFARDYSVEPNSRALGGTVPPIRRHSGAHEEIRKAAFRMKTPEEISGIIQVGVNQYVILKYEGMTEPVEHDPKDVEVTLHEELREREVQTMVAETFKKLNEQARIDNYITGESKSPIDQTAGRELPNIGLEQAIQRR